MQTIIAMVIFLQMIFCMNQARADHSGTTEAMFLCARSGRGFRGFLSNLPSVFILKMKSTEQALQTWSHCKLDAHKRKWSLGPLSHLQLYDHHSKDGMLLPPFIFSAQLLCRLTLHRREVRMGTVAWCCLLGALFYVPFWVRLPSVFFFLLSATAHITVCYNELWLTEF